MKLVTTALEWSYAAGETDVRAETLEAAAELLTLRRDATRVIDGAGQSSKDVHLLLRNIRISVEGRRRLGLGPAGGWSVDGGALEHADRDRSESVGEKDRRQSG